MQIEELPITSIKPYEKNPRKNDGAVNGVAESIRQFGFQQPIVIDANNVIVAGHTRYKAGLKLGLKIVPCVRADKLTKEQVKAYRILDNKLNELAIWDFNALADELRKFSFESEEFSILFPSFDNESYLLDSDSQNKDNEDSSPTRTVNTQIQSTTPQKNYKYDYEKLSEIFEDNNNKQIKLVVHLEKKEDIIELGEAIGMQLNPSMKVIYF